MQEIFVVRGLASTGVQMNLFCHHYLEKTFFVLSILGYPSNTADNDKGKKKNEPLSC